MHMLTRIRRFFNEYRALGFVVIAILTGLVLDLTGNDTAAHWVLGTSALIAVIPLLWDMVQTLRTGGYGIDILAATAIITSVILQEYWAGIIIVLMLTGGEALEDYAESRAKAELNSLLSHKPNKAHILRGRKIIDVTVRSINPGDKLVVMPGEVVPVDAAILEGHSSFDESSLTGESLPVEKNVNEEILSGSINLEGAITVKALRAAADSQYEQIIKLVRSAAATQSPFVRLADRYSIPFTIVSFIIAGTAWVISGDPERFLEVLVVATPCPLLLGAPIALISGMSRAAKHGIIVKTGSALERLAEIRTIALDKTGTLTVGQPVADEVTALKGHTKSEVLGYAAALEQHSNHVLAKAIVKAAEEKKVKIQKAKNIKELSGRGMSGRLSGKDILVGRLSLLKDHDVAVPDDFKENAVKHTASYVAINGRLAGVIMFADEIRHDATDMLERLKRAGVKNIVMVTGDNTAAAISAAKQLNITDVYPECLPADKLAVVDQLPERPVAFVGDGVNDAPVLTASEVGIALGARGSTAASESADVVILLDDVNRVARAVEIAKRTFGIARQSILIGILISLVLMAVFSTGKFKAIQGALLQEVVDIIVILNALRAHGSWKRPSFTTTRSVPQLQSAE